MIPISKKIFNVENHIARERLIGVVGGVGPEASNKFCEFLIKNKRAGSDQDHLLFLHYCNPKIPDRTEFILGKGEDPRPEIIRTCKILQEAGSSFLVIPCNTAHAFLKDIQESVDIPIVDMTKVLVKKVLEEFPPISKVGILATTGSIKAGIYQAYFENVGVKTLLPSKKDQEELVMKAVYGINGIKAGNKTAPKKLLIKAAQKLIDQGAEALVLGCTEIPLILKKKDLGVKLFDPMELVAQEVIEYLEQEPIEMITITYELTRENIFQDKEVIKT
ncbi:aspartate racemase [Candidatus Pacearchaeota archaeon CG10_big_fil_rev_8_21_14_0_10_32_14]|nr:MAG: aspartate racemase [Candidatus Pacearchaeota archaeon CG10_big_fil_rev_8_21_14_0_10_32_14]